MHKARMIAIKRELDSIRDLHCYIERYLKSNGSVTATVVESATRDQRSELMDHLELCVDILGLEAWE